MKKQFITAVLAGGLSMSVALPAFAADDLFTPEMGSVNKSSADYQRWAKPKTLKTDAQGFVLGKDGKRLSIPLTSSQDGYFKANADKTGFEMGATGPLFYTEDGKAAGTQMPAPPNMVPGSPLARQYAKDQADTVMRFADMEDSTGNYTATQRIDANSNKADMNGGDIVNMDARLQRLQNQWNGTSGQFGRDFNGDNLTATDAINANQDSIGLMEDRLAGRNNAGAWGSFEDGTPMTLEEGFGTLHNNVGDVDKLREITEQKDVVDSIIANNIGIVDNRQHIEANEEQLLDHEGRITKNREDIDDNKHRLNNVEGHLAENDGKIDKNTSAIDKLNQRADIGENGTIAQNSKRLDAHDSQIADNTKAIEQNKSDIKDLADNTGIRFDQNEQKISDNAVKIAENRSQLDKNTSDIDKLNQRADIGENGAIAQNTKKTAENKDRLDGKGGAFGKWANGDNKTVEEGFADHDKRLNAQNVEIDTNSRAIEGLGQQAADHGKRIAQNEDAIVNINEKTDINAGNISHNANAISANSEAISQNKTDIKHVNDRIGDLGTADQMAVIDEKTGGFKRDKNGNIIHKGQEAEVNALAATAADKKENTVEDWVAQGKAAYQDLNKRFDTMQTGDRAYIDQTAQQTLKSANDYTDSRYNQLNGKVKKLRARADSGIAGATAIGSLAFDTLKANSLAGGLGIAKNKVAGAFGYQRNFNENWRARGTVSVSDNYVQGGASVGYSW